MSRGSVFKLSGNLALGGGSDTYSTNQLESIKSSLRLLKARQSQKKSQQNIDYGNNNYGGTYSSNTGQRQQLKRNENKDYNYFQTNAKNHVPMNNYENQNYNGGYQQPQYNKGNSRNSQYDNQRTQVSNSKNSNYPQTKNDFPANSNKNDFPANRNDFPANNNKNDFPANRNDFPGNINKNSYNNQNDYTPYSYNDNKEQSARNNSKARTQQPKPYNQEQYYQQQPLNNKNQQDSRPKAQTRPPLRKQQLNQQANYNQSPNENQQKSIKQANLESKQEIVEYDPSTFVACTVGCGRKFNPDSISKHQAICYKVFQKKRKQFNTQQQRILDQQHKKIVKNVVAQEKRNAANDKKNKKSGANDQKMSKWKAQSLALRSMIKNNRGEEPTAQQKQKLEEIKNMGMIKCPHCGRSFNENSGPKHITFCENQSKKGKLKR